MTEIIKVLPAKIHHHLKYAGLTSVLIAYIVLVLSSLSSPSLPYMLNLFFVICCSFQNFHTIFQINIHHESLIGHTVQYACLCAGHPFANIVEIIIVTDIPQLYSLNTVPKDLKMKNVPFGVRSKINKLLKIKCANSLSLA